MKRNHIFVIIIVLGVTFLGILFFRETPQSTEKNKSEQPTEKTDLENSFTIQMNPDGFEPKKLDIKKGDGVCWINKDNDARWPASNIHPTHEIYPEFDSIGPVPIGEIWCFIASIGSIILLGLSYIL